MQAGSNFPLRLGGSPRGDPHGWRIEVVLNTAWEIRSGTIIPTLRKPGSGPWVFPLGVGWGSVAAM